MKTSLGLLLTTAFMLQGGGAQSSVEQKHPEEPQGLALALKSPVPALLAAKQQEIKALKDQIHEVETKLQTATALIVAQQSQHHIASPLRRPDYYRKKGSEGPWIAVGPDYEPWSHDSKKYDYVWLMRSRPLTTESTYSRELQMQLTQLKKQLLEAEIFLYNEFIDTFNKHNQANKA